MFKLFRPEKSKSIKQLIGEYCIGKDVLKIVQFSPNVHMVIYYNWSGKDVLYINADVLQKGIPVPLSYQMGLYVVLLSEDTYAIGKIHIYHDQVNNGIGTILVNSLIEFAKERNVKYIVGNMSVGEDDVHASRQRHFYKKLGFATKGFAFKMKL